MTITDKRTATQIANFEKDLLLGSYMDMAIAKGGTGHLRKPLSEKEYMKRKNLKHMQKQSRKANR